MQVPKRRHSKGRVRRKRNEKLQAVVVKTVKCKQCGADKLPHRLCQECKKYK